MTNAEWERYLARAKAQYGDALDLSSIPEKFLPYFRTGQRIRVITHYRETNYTRTGTVGITTGWRPALLLMHRSSDHGSSDTLHERDEITHVQHGRTYVPVESLYRKPA